MSNNVANLCFILFNYVVYFCNAAFSNLSEWPEIKTNNVSDILILQIFNEA